jgi:hypothetical protein
MWKLSDTQLRSVYEQVFRLLLQKAGSKGPLRYGDFSVPFLTLRVAVMSTTDRRADEASQARVTLINLMAGDATATHLAVRSRTPVRKSCTRVDGNNVLRGVLALFAKNEAISSQALNMVLAKLPRRPLGSVKRGIRVASRGKGPMQKQRRLLPSTCKNTSTAVSDEDTTLVVFGRCTRTTGHCG